MALFKRKPKEMSELDLAVDAVVAAEDREAKAKQALADVEKKLQAAYAQDPETEPDTDEIIRASAKLKALAALRKEAKSQAGALIAKGQAGSRARLTEVEAELAGTRAAIDTRKIKIIAGFALKHGFRVSWPTKNNAGVVHLPAMTIEGEALKEIANGVKSAVHVDKDDSKLAELYKERTLLGNLTLSIPPDALEVLLADRRKR